MTRHKHGKLSAEPLATTENANSASLRRALKAQSARADLLQRELAETRAELQSRHEAALGLLYDLYASEADPLATGAALEYRTMVRGVKEVVRNLVPVDRTVAVISKGDDALTDLYGRKAWHFPSAPDGRYAGFYPRCAISAISHLETLRARGADYLIVPATGLWWLDHYRSLRTHLEVRYREVYRQDDVCVGDDV